MGFGEAGSVSARSEPRTLRWFFSCIKCSRLVSWCNPQGDASNVILFSSSKKEQFSMSNGFKTLLRRLKTTWNVAK